MNTFTKRVIAGFVMGVAGILPGVSGGLLAMSMGLYQPMLSSVTTFFKNPKRSVRFLLPIVIGGGAGLLSFAFILSGIMKRAETEATIFFAGLIIGGLPELIESIKDSKNGTAARPSVKWSKRFLLFALGFAFMLIFTMFDTTFKPADSAVTFDGLIAILSGAIVAFGTLVPGVSNSLILIYLGAYAPMMEAISSFHIRPLMFLVLGFVVMAVLLVKLVEWVFRKYKSTCANIVLGFVVANIIFAIPWSAFASRFWLDSVLLVAGIVSSTLITKGLGDERSEKHVKEQC